MENWAKINLCQLVSDGIVLDLFIEKIPVAEFSASTCIISKFICSSENGIPRLLITENDTSYIKATFTKSGWCEYEINLKLEFIIISYLKVKGKQAYT